MNDAFNDRQKGFEAKFQLDQEQAFRAVNRGNKLLGLWAAERMGLSGGDAEAYAKQVVAADFDDLSSHDDVIAKVEKDLKEKGVAMSFDDVRQQLEKCHAEARAQISAEAKG